MFQIRVVYPFIAFVIYTSHSPPSFLSYNLAIICCHLITRINSLEHTIDMSRPAAKSTEIDLRVSKPSRPAINTSSLDAKQAHIPNRAHSGASVHYETHSRGSSSNTK